MFTGSMVALITPMKDDQSVDLVALQRLITFHLENGTEALVLVGTTGEAATLNEQEKALIVQTACELVQGKIPLIVGTSAQGTAQTIERTQAAKALGADAALIMTPAYIKVPQRGLITHYQTIAEACELPLILYNVPGRTACDLLPETVATLSKHPWIVGIKEATGDVNRTLTLRQTCDPDFVIVSGEDSLTLELMKAGAQGVISVTANVAPKLMHEFCSAALAGNWKQAQEHHQQLKRLHEALFIETNPIPVKAALHMMGLCKSVLRSPLPSLDIASQPKVKTCLQSLGLI